MMRMRPATYQGIAETAEKYKKICIDEMIQLAAEQAVARNPDYFGGTQAGSEYWQEVNTMSMKVLST